MAFTKRIPVRFDDVDFARVVYYRRLFGYCHQVFEDCFGEAVGVPYAQMLQLALVEAGSGVSCKSLDPSYARLARWDRTYRARPAVQAVLPF